MWGERVELIMLLRWERREIGVSGVGCFLLCWGPWGCRTVLKRETGRPAWCDGTRSGWIWLGRGGSGRFPPPQTTLPNRTPKGRRPQHPHAQCCSLHMPSFLCMMQLLFPSLHMPSFPVHDAVAVPLSGCAAVPCACCFMCILPMPLPAYTAPFENTPYESYSGFISCLGGRDL